MEYMKNLSDNLDLLYEREKEVLSKIDAKQKFDKT